MSEKQTAPGLVPVRGSVSAVEAKAEHDRLKAQLPPGSTVTADMMRPWLDGHAGRNVAPRRPKPKTRRRNGGPPAGLVDGVTVARITETITELGGAPTQPVVAERLGCTDRRIRQVLNEAGLKWGDVHRIAARNR